MSSRMTWSPTIDDKLPFCTGNLLDQRQFRYETEGSYGSNLMTRSSGDGSCQLVDYTAERIVACLDSLHHRQPSNTKLHFLFMGDSRMRQQFLNFVRVYPFMNFGITYFLITMNRWFLITIQGWSLVTLPSGSKKTWKWRVKYLDCVRRSNGRLLWVMTSRNWLFNGQRPSQVNDLPWYFWVTIK